MKASTAYKLLVLILIVGAVLRFSGLGNNSFVADEFLDINSAYGYAKTGEWKAWDFNLDKPSEVNINEARDERAIVYKWQVAQLFKFLPPTETVARSVSVLWGILSILVIFWSALIFTRRREIALIAAFLFAVSISGIIFDRTLRMYAMFFPLYLATATLTFLTLEKMYNGRVSFLKKIWERFGMNILFALPAMLFFTLSLLTHQLSGTLLFSVAVYLIIRTFQIYRQSGKLRHRYSVLLLIGLTAVVMIAIFFPHFFRTFSGGLIFFDNHYGYFKYILRDYEHSLLATLFIIFGAWWIGKRQGLEKESLWLSILFLVPLIMAIWLWRRNIGAQYIFFAQSFVIILIAGGIFGLWQLICEKWHIIDTKKSIAVLGLLILIVPNFSYFLEKNNTYHETSSGSNPNYRKVFGYFKKYHQHTDVLVTRNVRNYYFSGAKVPVYDLGDEISKTRLSQEEIEKLMRTYPTGWVILSDNDYDYVGKGVKEFLNKNLTRESNDQVRGPIDVFTWGR